MAMFKIMLRGAQRASTLPVAMTLRDQRLRAGALAVKQHDNKEAINSSSTTVPQKMELSHAVAGVMVRDGDGSSLNKDRQELMVMLRL